MTVPLWRPLAVAKIGWLTPEKRNPHIATFGRHTFGRLVADPTNDVGETLTLAGKRPNPQFPFPEERGIGD